MELGGGWIPVFTGMTGGARLGVGVLGWPAWVLGALWIPASAGMTMRTFLGSYN